MYIKVDWKAIYYAINLFVVQVVYFLLIWVVGF